MFSRTGLGLVFCLLGVNACSLVQAPTELPDIRLNRIDARSITLDRQEFILHLALDNPNPVKLRVASAKLKLDVEEFSAGTGELLEGFDIPAGASGTASVRVVTDLVRQGPEFLQWLLSGDTGLDYRVSGYVDLVGLGLGRIPVDERGQLSLKPPAGGARTLAL